MDRIKRVKDVIYLMIFSEPLDPLYAFEISRRLYGRENKRVFLEIRSLEKQKWIRTCAATIQQSDGRSQQRIYYYANARPILDQIEKINENAFFDTTSEHVLKMVLDTQAFRYLIRQNLPKTFSDRPLYAIDFILSKLDLAFILSISNPFFVKASKGISTISDYEKRLNSLGKNKKFQDAIPEVSHILFGKKEIPEEVKNHLPYLFIFPGKLTDCHEGFSDFGKAYFSAASTARSISRLFESTPTKKK